jgi:ubiquitin carboxyl-terminal hydrolase L5
VDERKRPQTESGDVFHFIAYIPKNGKVYELDGLQPGPIVVGNYEDVTPKANGDSGAEGSSLAPAASFDMDSLAWLPVARAAIQERIERYSASEIKFNLMAVVQDKRAILEKRQNQLTKEAGMADDEPSVQELKAQLEQEAEKRRLWESENQRRRHNYLPFCVELLKALAGSGKLPTLTEEARERVSSKKRKMEGQGK